jgi:hypothetical protein
MSHSGTSFCRGATAGSTHSTNIGLILPENVFRGSDNIENLTRTIHGASHVLKTEIPIGKLIKRSIGICTVNHDHASRTITTTNTSTTISTTAIAKTTAIIPTVVTTISTHASAPTTSSSHGYQIEFDDKGKKGKVIMVQLQFS